MKAFLIMTFLLIGSFAVNAQQTTLEEDIREFLKVSGSAQLGMQVLETMTGQFKQMLPDVPAEFWTETMKEFKPEALANLMIPIYAKHFTQEEIRQLIHFYKTPVGQKLAATLPAVSQESMIAGQKWGQEIGAKVAQKLQEKGYIKN